MDIKDKTLLAQREILQGLISLELAISAIYEVFSKKFPEHSAFWFKLAKDEKRHAAFLKGVQKQTLDQGYLLENIGGFSSCSAKDVIVFIENESAKANKLGYTLNDAVKCAVNIESSLIDARFYDTVSSKAPGYKSMANILLKETNKHLEDIHQLMLHHCRRQSGSRL